MKKYLKKYLYQKTSPISAVTYKEADTGEEVSKTLIPGKSLSLPEDDEQVKRLVALGHLTLVKESERKGKA